MGTRHHTVTAPLIDEGLERLTLHLGTLPDGSLPGFRFVQLADSAADAIEDLDHRVVPMPKRLFFDVEMTNGLQVVVDADIPDHGMPVIGFPGSIAIRAITIGSVDGSPIDLEAANAVTVTREWFLVAFTMAALHSGGGNGFTVDFGPDTPAGWQLDETAGRELVWRLQRTTANRRGRPAPDQEKVQQAWDLRQRNRSYREIGDELGVSKSTAERWVKQEQRRRDFLDDND